MKNQLTKSRTLVSIIAGLPIYAIISFYFFVMGWRLYRGYWPSYGQPDAGAFHGLELIFDVPVSILQIFGMLSIVFFLPAAVGALLSPRLMWLRKPSMVSILAWLLLVFLFKTDPGGFFDWFWD